MPRLRARRNNPCSSPFRISGRSTIELRATVPWRARSPLVPLLHDHSGGTEQLTVVPISNLEDFRNQMVLVARLSWLSGHRFVQCRIEGLAHRIDRLETE